MSGLVGIVAIGMSLLFASCTEGQTHQESTATVSQAIAEEPIYSAEEDLGEEIEGRPCPFAPFEDNNARLEDREAPFNQGTEPLADFLLSYTKDPSLVKRRMQLPMGVLPPSAVGDPFTIIPPDSTGYFASWLTLEEDTVSFCSGYLDSDILEQYTFARQSPEAKWYLIDYYNAATQDNISEYAD